MNNARNPLASWTNERLSIAFDACEQRIVKLLNDQKNGKIGLQAEITELTREELLYFNELRSRGVEGFC